MYVAIYNSRLYKMLLLKYNQYRTATKNENLYVQTDNDNGITKSVKTIDHSSNKVNRIFGGKRTLNNN